MRHCSYTTLMQLVSVLPLLFAPVKAALCLETGCSSFRESSMGSKRRGGPMLSLKLAEGSVVSSILHKEVMDEDALGDDDAMATVGLVISPFDDGR